MHNLQHAKVCLFTKTAVAVFQRHHINSVYSINIISLPVVQCPAHDVRYDSSGVILSPGWPESYPNLQMCSWSVAVEKGYNVTITFESFHTEREFDVLEIFDGENTHTPEHAH